MSSLQLFLIGNTIEIILGMANTCPTEAPAIPSVIMTKDTDGKLRKGSWINSSRDILCEMSVCNVFRVFETLA